MHSSFASNFLASFAIALCVSHQCALVQHIHIFCFVCVSASASFLCCSVFRFFFRLICFAVHPSLRAAWRIMPCLLGADVYIEPPLVGAKHSELHCGGSSFSVIAALCVHYNAFSDLCHLRKGIFGGVLHVSILISTPLSCPQWTVVSAMTLDQR